MCGQCKATFAVSLIFKEIKFSIYFFRKILILIINEIIRFFWGIIGISLDMKQCCLISKIGFFDKKFDLLTKKTLIHYCKSRVVPLRPI
jgi:hypothetical protein